MIKNFNLIIGARSNVPNWHDKNLTHLITIRDPDVKEPYMAHFARKPKMLKLIFEDRLHELQSNPPTEVDMIRIINFGREIKNDLDSGKEIILGVNCFAGICRSTAAAYIVLNVLNPDKEVDNFNYILSIRPVAVPNFLMVEIADKLLSKQGKMGSLARSYRKKLFINDAWA